MIDVDTMCVIGGMETMNARLKDARKRAGFSAAAKAAEALGIKTSTYAAHENGQNDFDADYAKRYGRKFKVSASWLLTGEDIDIQRVPIGQEFEPDPDPEMQATFGSETGPRGGPSNGIAEVDVTVGLGAGGLTTVSDATTTNGMKFAAEIVRDFWVLPAWMLSSLNIRSEHAAAFKAQGDSMEPSILNNEVVFVDTRHRVPSPPGIYALADVFGGVVMKRVEVISNPRDEPVRIRIISDNPRHETKEADLAEVQIIGRYLGKFTTELGH